MNALAKLGLQLLEFIGLAIYSSHYFPSILPSCDTTHLISWSKSPAIPLHGIVVNLHSITIGEVTHFLDYHVPVHYIYHEAEPSIHPRSLSAVDMDAHHADAHASFISSRRWEKRHARELRRSDWRGLLHVQKVKQKYFLKDKKDRWKQILKKKYTDLYYDYKSEVQRHPTGDIAILYVDETYEDEDFNDKDPPKDFTFLPDIPGPSTLLSVNVSTTICLSPDVENPDAPGWKTTSPLPIPSHRVPRPSPQPQPQPQPQPCSPSPLPILTHADNQLLDPVSEPPTLSLPTQHPTSPTPLQIAHDPPLTGPMPSTSTVDEDVIMAPPSRFLDAATGIDRVTTGPPETSHQSGPEEADPKKSGDECCTNNVVCDKDVEVIDSVNPLVPMSPAASQIIPVVLAMPALHWLLSQFPDM
ncbi:hypothetical protein JVU11DRAFT_10663 [Chiua virens]|nr:hypothetical protein JVU11DRAFT_10663 [Chiua virens]